MALENIGQPLLSILTIPSDIMAAVGRVYDSLITRGTASNVTRGLLVPGITAAFAIANVADTIYTAVKEGNLKDAFTAVVNAPGIVAGAFINGYRPYFGKDATAIRSTPPRISRVCCPRGAPSTSSWCVCRRPSRPR